MKTATVLLIWLDGRTPTMKQDVDHEATEITVPLPDGNHYFRTTGALSMDGYVLFREVQPENK